jgi:MoaA/NifB/PqqE/SkfB family radical SAM enzyme
MSVVVGTAEAPPAVRVAPKITSGTLMIHLLGRCNLECAHCYMDGSPSRTERLEIAHVLGAIAESEALGVTSLFLTGGEALLYRELDTALEACSHVPGLRVTVCTNGMLVKERHAARFSDLDVDVNVSVDGDPEFHDRFRRRQGAFRATEKGVRTLVEAGVAVAIVTTITRANRESLARTVGWAAEVGANRVLVLPLLKLGRAVEIADQCLGAAEMDEMLLQLSDLANAYRPAGLACRLNGVATRRFLMAHPCGAYVCNGAQCHRGVSKELKKLVVREDGTVLPEMTNISRRFAIGNIRDAPLTALVRRYLDQDYARFDALCRATYNEVLPGWNSTIVPWDEIVAARSHTWDPDARLAVDDSACHACAQERVPHLIHTPNPRERGICGDRHDCAASGDHRAAEGSWS